MKPGKPTAEEWAAMKEHTNIGVNERNGNPEVEKLFSTFPEGNSPSVRSIVRGHHERWDGNGYPNGLKGGDIPIGAQLIGIGEMFDSLVTDRPFREGKPYEAARAIMQESADKGQFNPELVKTLFEKVLPSSDSLKACQGERETLREALSDRDYRLQLHQNDRMDADAGCYQSPDGETFSDNYYLTERR